MSRKRRATASVRNAKRRRKSQKMSVYVVDLHDGAMLPFIEAIKAKDLPTSGVKMLHFDSHPDLGNIDKRSKHLHAVTKGKFDLKGVDSLTDIATWITPLVLAGYLEECIWVSGHWCTQIKEGSYDLVCGIDKYDGRLKTCDADGTNESHAIDNYWAMDETEGELEDLKYPKPWKLHVVKYSKEGTLTKEQTDLIKRVCCGQPWVLDIDEDFFSCNNPYKDSFVDCFGIKTFNLIKKIYDIGSPYDSKMKQILKKKLFLKTKSEFMKHPHVHTLMKALKDDGFDGKTLLSGFYDSFNGYFSTTDRPKRAHVTVESLVDFDDLHETGMLSTLPHHISRIDEIASMGNTTTRLLKSMDRPVHVTLATSRTDRYLPDSQASLIHGMLDEMMEIIYDKVHMIRRDKPEFSINDR